MKGNSDFSKDLIRSAGSIGGIKNLSDAVGMPDDLDKENIRKIILNYEKEHPGEINFAKGLGEYWLNASQTPTLKKKWKRQEGIVDIETNRTYDMELPVGLGQKLENYIPTLFRDRKHYQWFKKNFPELMIRRNI